MDLTLVQYLLGAASGLFVGFTPGVVGGGGFILALPLIVYLVSVPDPHMAIGTTAVAIAANAAINLWKHAQSGMVKWRCASVFAVSGVAGGVCRIDLWKDAGRAEAFISFRVPDDRGRHIDAAP